MRCSPVPESPEAAYERGVTAAELREHGGRLNKLNGSIARHAAAIEALTLVVQELTSTTAAGQAQVVARMDAAAETVRTTAAALAAAEVARVAAETAAQARTERRWTPLGKLALIVGIIVGALDVWVRFRG